MSKARPVEASAPASNALETLTLYALLSIAKAVVNLNLALHDKQPQKAHAPAIRTCAPSTFPQTISRMNVSPVVSRRARIDSPVFRTF